MKLYINHSIVLEVKNHKIYSIRTTKISLNSYENKVYWVDSINSLAYGHWRINDLKAR